MLGFLQGYFPVAVIMAVILVVLFTELCKKAIEKLETSFLKKDKSVKIFKFSKIWLVVFCSAFFSVALVLAGFVSWKQLYVYTPAILGMSVFLYDAILKPLNKLKNDSKN